MTDIKFKVDQKLTVFSYGKPSHIVVVRKVLKDYCECTDNTKWNRDGHRRPRDTSYALWRVLPATEEHLEHFRRQRLLGTICRASSSEWERLSTEDLIHVSNLLLRDSK